MADAKDHIKAVVVTTRNQIRDAIRSALKAAEIGDDHITYPEKPKKCLEALAATKRCIFVADWDFSTELVLTSLKSIRDFNQEETRVTFLLAAQLDNKIIAAGAEF